jgi:hypothetical protein
MPTATAVRLFSLDTYNPQDEPQGGQLWAFIAFYCAWNNVATLFTYNGLCLEVLWWKKRKIYVENCRN